MGFSRQEYLSDLPFPSPVDHILSDCSVCLGWPYMAWLVVSLSKTRLWFMWLDWLVFCDCGSWWQMLRKDKSHHSTQGASREERQYQDPRRNLPLWPKLLALATRSSSLQIHSTYFSQPLPCPHAFQAHWFSTSQGRALRLACITWMVNR